MLNKLLVIDGQVICLIQVEDTGHILGIKYYRTLLEIIKPQFRVRAPTGYMVDRGK